MYGASDTPLNAVLEVEYSEALDAVTVNASTVTLTGSAAVPVSLSLQEGGKVVRIVPDAPLQANSYYTLRLSGIQDLDAQAASTLATVARSRFDGGINQKGEATWRTRGAREPRSS